MVAKTISAMCISNEQIIIIAGMKVLLNLAQESARLFTFRESRVHLHFLVYRTALCSSESETFSVHTFVCARAKYKFANGDCNKGADSKFS